VWDNIDRVDKYIYEDYDEYCIYDDYVDKGSSKKTNKKHRLKINKAIRYMCL
jgi:predicted nucleotide-binding protein (sugar kinase/HSP70/actin superfamily)